VDIYRKKLLAVHSCEICATLKQNETEFGSDTYITMKNYHDGALLVPSINFTMYMSRCENLLLAYFKENKHLPGIGEKIAKILQTYLLRLFVRDRIHYVLRFENRSTCNCQQKNFEKKLAKLQSK